MHAVIIIILILAILLVIFTLQNSVEISINVFFWEIPNAPLVLVLLSCVLLGYIISAIYFYPRLWTLKKESRKISKSKEKLEKELEDQTSDSSETHPEGIELEEEEDDDEDKKFFRE
ncbi:MAG TPA: LapA family protein [Tangfeifania sp.]|nr:LapA family protein [Tangfeifania sp.]